MSASDRELICNNELQMSFYANLELRGSPQGNNALLCRGSDPIARPKFLLRCANTFHYLIY